jgi:hypothetical protein
MARKLSEKEQADLERRVEAGPVCELIGGVPFVLPYAGYEVPWFLAPILEEARKIGKRLDLAYNGSERTRAVYRNQVQRYLAVIERKIGITPDQMIAATRGMVFGPTDEGQRESLREDIRLKRVYLTFKNPTPAPAVEMTNDERRALDRIERRRRQGEAEMSQAKDHRQRMLAYQKSMQAIDEAMGLTRRIRDRQEKAWAATALQEIEFLATLRGDALDGRVRKSPLDRLRHAELITEEQHKAGCIYGDTWRRLYGGKNGDGTGCGTLDPLESRVADIGRLDQARGYAIAEIGGRFIQPGTGLGGDARLIKLCDDICGAEKSLREAIGTSAHKRKIAMERLRTALGLLALHYGLIKTREDELRAA